MSLISDICLCAKNLKLMNTHNQNTHKKFCAKRKLIDSGSNIRKFFILSDSSSVLKSNNSVIM